MAKEYITKALQIFGANKQNPSGRMDKVRGRLRAFLALCSEDGTYYWMHDHSMQSIKFTFTCEPLVPEDVNTYLFVCEELDDNSFLVWACYQVADSSKALSGDNLVNVWDQNDREDIEEGGRTVQIPPVPEIVEDFRGRGFSLEMMR